MLEYKVEGQLYIYCNIVFLTHFLGNGIYFQGAVIMSRYNELPGQQNKV